MPRTTISSRDDIVDSRSILERLEELNDEIESAGEDGPDEDPVAERDTLQKLVTDINDVSGDSAEDGATLIRDSYFQDYAQELAEDIGAINKDATWPNTCIDWEQAARELQYDYSTVEWDDITYWVRS